MVFRIKAELTEEDRAAWRLLALQREKARRKKRWAAVRIWLGNKLLSLSLVVFGILGMYALSLGRATLRDQVYIGVVSPLFLFGGILICVVNPYPFKRSKPLSEKDFPPSGLLDAPVRAAFFGDGCFVFRASGEKIRLGYSTVTGAWEDGGRFYLFFADRPPLVLPKRGLGRWMPEDFRDFLERELEVPVERMK